jgi:hypothetical protein
MFLHLWLYVYVFLSFIISLYSRTDEGNIIDEEFFICMNERILSTFVCVLMKCSKQIEQKLVCSENNAYGIEFLLHLIFHLKLHDKRNLILY